MYLDGCSRISGRAARCIEGQAPRGSPFYLSPMSSRSFRNTPPVSASTLLVRGLRKRFGEVVAVDGLDLDVRAGECFGLLGPNGAGKTTTIEICEGLTAPDEGEVVVCGSRWSGGTRELRERLGIQLQETQLSEK